MYTDPLAHAGSVVQSAGGSRELSHVGGGLGEPMRERERERERDGGAGGAGTLNANASKYASSTHKDAPKLGAPHGGDARGLRGGGKAVDAGGGGGGASHNNSVAAECSSSREGHSTKLFDKLTQCIKLGVLPAHAELTVEVELCTRKRPSVTLRGSSATYVEKFNELDLEIKRNMEHWNIRTGMRQRLTYMYADVC